MNVKIITMLLCLVGAFLQLCAFTSLEEMLIAPIEKGGYDVALLGTAARCLDRKFFLCDLMITEANLRLSKRSVNFATPRQTRTDISTESDN